MIKNCLWNADLSIKEMYVILTSQTGEGIQTHENSLKAGTRGQEWTKYILYDKAI